MIVPEPLSKPTRLGTAADASRVQDDVRGAQGRTTRSPPSLPPRCQSRAECPLGARGRLRFGRKGAASGVTPGACRGRRVRVRSALTGVFLSRAHRPLGASGDQPGLHRRPDRTLEEARVVRGVRPRAVHGPAGQVQRRDDGAGSASSILRPAGTCRVTSRSLARHFRPAAEAAIRDRGFSLGVAGLVVGTPSVSGSGISHPVAWSPGAPSALSAGA
jgi:hypothetical protein